MPTSTAVIPAAADSPMYPEKNAASESLFPLLALPLSNLNVHKETKGITTAMLKQLAPIAVIPPSPKTTA